VCTTDLMSLQMFDFRILYQSVSLHFLFYYKLIHILRNTTRQQNNLPHDQDQAGVHSSLEVVPRTSVDQWIHPVNNQSDPRFPTNMVTILYHQ